MNIPTIAKLKELFSQRHTKRGYYDFVKISLGVSVIILVLIIFLYDALERFELTTFDYRMRLRRKKPVDERVVLIDMGEDSIRKIGRWPWPREWHATMISALTEHGADRIVFDVIFSEESSEFSDTAMAQAMRRSGRVYLPYAVELEGYDRRQRRWNVRGIILPLEKFSKWAKGKGHITIVPDSDGTVRNVPLIIETKEKVYPQLGLTVASSALGVGHGKNAVKALRIPVDDKNQILINWVGRWGDDFKHYSYIDVITSYQRIQEGKAPLLNLREFKDKICIIGLTATGLYDIKSTPLQPTYPAVGTNANIINSILNKDFIRRAPRWIDGLLIIIVGMVLSMNISKARPIRGAAIMAWMVIGYLLISYAVLDFGKTWIAVIYPILAIILGYLVMTFYNQIAISIERARLFMLATKDGLTGLYVKRHFNLLLEAEMNSVKTRGGRLSIIMADIDHFKKVNDTHGHQVGDFILKEIAGIVMSCCRQLDIPSRYGGEEFIIMLPGADKSEAVMAAERIRKRTEEHNFRMGQKTYRITVSFGVAAFKDENTRDELIRKADEALYKAKGDGRNRVCACNSVG